MLPGAWLALLSPLLYAPNFSSCPDLDGAIPPPLLAMAALQMETLSDLPDWNAGELAVQRLLKVPAMLNPTSRGLPPHYAARVRASALVAVGAVDRDTGRPWTTIWGGKAGFATRIAVDVLGMRSLVDGVHDPVVKALLGSMADGQVYQQGKGEDMVLSALAISLETRDRVKLGGRVMAGVKTDRTEEKGVAEVQLTMAVTESLGNCPKYLNNKQIRAHVPEPWLVSDALPLPPRALELLARADLFFLSSTDGSGAMDTNHRGGAPGLLRVVRNGEGDRGVVLAYPEFSGNRLYQTLGNIHLDPRIGVVVPDFGTADALYMTGTARILVGEEAAALLPRANVAVVVEVLAARYVADGLPFRGETGEFSPYNPPPRRLKTELEAAGVDPAVSVPGASGVATATLKTKEILSVDVARYTFAVKRNSAGHQGPLWKPGHHVTLDFSAELYMGYNHMNDYDPQSLNDDFVRTFTVSNPPNDKNEMQITVRRHGPATGLLWPWHTRVPLELPVVGFGGGSLQIVAEPERQAVFVATGVGITPLLAQAGDLLRAEGASGKKQLSVLWGVRLKDIPFAVDSFKRIPGLAGITGLFVSGTSGDAVDGDAAAKEARELGAELVPRRLEREDLNVCERGENRVKPRYYVCAGPGATKTVTGWLEGEDVATESFNY